VDVIVVVTIVGDTIGEVLSWSGMGARRSWAVGWFDWMEAEVVVGDAGDSSFGGSVVGF
jgi:hypothetical protein